jgi:4-amino-4-deoxy-L-arabinose transferase-like glycosyltransferase
MRGRRFWVLAFAVLALAAFNLTYRVGNESLTEWDESLYATSAFEMLESGNWVVTTFNGETDYYNAKPPLNVWLIALSLKVFGPSLAAMRVPSIVAAWLTVVVLFWWSNRRFGPRVALFSCMVLATSFGFLHVHSGRTDNPDALLALFFLLIAVTLDVSSERPWRRIWLGPLFAGVFLLKGMAILMPLLLVVIVEARRTGVDLRRRWLPLAAAAGLALVPSLAWAVPRWQADGWMFFDRMFFQDFVALSTTSVENQNTSELFYLNVLVKHHYDWIIAAITVVILFPPASWAIVRRSLAFWRSGDDRVWVIGFWTAIAILVPTAMRTNLPWYINPLYPMFALGVGWLLAYGFSGRPAPSHHRGLLIAMVVMAATLAEGKLIWYSYNYRALERSAQGLLLAEADRLRGARVFGQWDRADAIVLRGIVRGRTGAAVNVDEFLQQSSPGDYLVLPSSMDHDGLIELATSGRHTLYQRDAKSPDSRPTNESR